MTDETPLALIRKHLRINGLATHPLADAIAGAFAELNPTVRVLTELTVLDLRPGDIVVLTCPDRLAMDEVEQVTQQLKTQFPGHKCVLVETGKLAVVRPSPASMSASDANPPDYNG